MSKPMLLDLASYDETQETQETLALLKILAMGKQDIEAGRTTPAKKVISRLRAKYAKQDSPLAEVALAK
jgi:predicted transcriptional regulator